MADPALYALPPGVDFPAELVAGLLERMKDQPPEALARVTLILNTQRMRRRVTDCLLQSGALLLPRLLLLSDVPALGTTPLPAAVPPLRRRLELTVLLDRLLETGTTDFPRSALYDLADSLAALMEEMQGEGVPPDRIAALDVADHSAHWARTQAFLGIVAQTMDRDEDSEGRLRQAVLSLSAHWETQPPPAPVILAGSTGSRGTTALLMQAVARLPQGAVVLPGYDFEQPAAVWDRLDDALTAEDHPQFRFRALLDRLGCGPADVRPWTLAAAPSPDRNRLISLSLRPAPITDQWLAEGPSLPPLIPATREMTLIEAPSERTEAFAVALILRDAAERGVRAALVSPDRNLTRRVTAALDRWGIRPDDSAGRPLPLSAPGRFLRQIAGLIGERLTSDRLLALLKHPLAFSGPGRGAHLILTRELELHLRRHGPAFPTAESLAAWADTSRIDAAQDWARILGETLCPLATIGPLPLSAFVERHLATAERLARGFAADGSGALWEKEAGQKAQEAVAELRAEAGAAGTLTPGDYGRLFHGILQRHEVREAESVHPGIMIWGTIEARVQGADLVILGGLNEGAWPAQPSPDPWLNRAMRKAAGLLLPERRIGLSAHDYQQAVAAPRVVLTRATRGAEAETVPARWLNRLVNLMSGLPDRDGPQALEQMRDRGRHWLGLAARFDMVEPVPPAPRPSPRPPVEARPKRLSLTEIGRLVRDPYAIYARHVLRLSPLDPLRPQADPRLRGIVLHEILETFIRRGGTDRATLLATADEILSTRVAWPLARTVWRARIAKAADAFLAYSATTGGTPVLLEEKGATQVAGLEFTLTGKPDRIDRLEGGRLLLIDYKTGDPPSEKQQRTFDKQLLLAAAMAERGGFAPLGPSEVARLAFIGLKAELKKVETDLAPGQVGAVWDEFVRLISAYAQAGQGYTARRALMSESDSSDYDHLSRYGEWDMTQDPRPEDLT